MAWHTLSTVNDTQPGRADSKASVRWVTQAPTGQHEFTFKGKIKLQRYGGSRLFRLACEGRYYDRFGMPVLALCDDGLNKVTIPLPSETSCDWIMGQESFACSNGTDVRIITMHFSNNDDGIHRLVVTIPFCLDAEEGAMNLVGAITFAHQQQQVQPPVFHQEG